MKKRGVLMALTNAIEGRDDEYNNWYNNKNLLVWMRMISILHSGFDMFSDVL